MIRQTFIVFCAGALMVGCNIKKEEKGELPEIDVDVTADAGELPEYDVDWADVNIGTTTKTVSIPKVVVVMEEEEVEVPYIDIDMPDASDKEERTIMVEAEVTEKEHKLEIQEIWANKNNLYVISNLTPLEQSLGDQKMRVSDQVTMNVPDLGVKHYIIGARPNRTFNSQFKYVDTIEDAKKDIDQYTVIYSK